MDPSLYKACLNYLAERDQLKRSEWKPVMLNDVITLENELGAEFPKQYEEFLIKAGVGLELGGLAEWYHLDLSVGNNLIEANDKIRKAANGSAPPKDFLAIYDLKDGVYLGFEKEHEHYLPELMVWDSEEESYEVEAECLFYFLAENVECSEEEIEFIQTKMEEEISELIETARADMLPKFV